VPRLLLGCSERSEEGGLLLHLRARRTRSVRRLIRNLARSPRPAPVDCFFERPAEHENDEHQHNPDHDDLPLAAGWRQVWADLNCSESRRFTAPGIRLTSVHPPWCRQAIGNMDEKKRPGGYEFFLPSPGAGRSGAQVMLKLSKTFIMGRKSQ